MSNYLLSKRYAREAVQAMQKEYKSYLLKFPEKTNDRFTVERANRINDLINFVNASDDEEQRKTREIEKLKQRIDQRERAIIQIIDSLIMVDASTTFHVLTNLLHYDPQQTARFVSLKRDVLHKFDIKRFFNTIDRL